MSGPAPDNAPIRTLRWPWASLWGDLLRGGAGAFIALTAALLNPPGSTLQLVLLGLTAVLACLALLALRRRMTIVTLSSLGVERIAPFGLRKSLAWDTLDGFELHYYGARSRALGPTGGFMELRLRSGPVRLTIDDGIDGFRAVLDAAHQAAKAREIAFTGVTDANLQHLLRAP